ncbi:unnamed protein product [Allacma fusca]|uniref:Palmitoyltransferase n=1 Tax=Allacma fusca TaxID=39272 RepID=A0A8J2L9V7_9HEXA|nr:unnamed protein product [Allacma fusca]
MRGFFHFVKFMIEDHRKYIQHQRTDFVVYVVLNILIVLTLYYGVIVAFPLMFDTCSTPVLMLNYLWGVWLYVAEQSNLQLIRLRDSSIFTEGDVQSDVTTGRKDAVSRGTQGKPLTRTDRDSTISRRSKVPDSWHYCVPCEVTVPPRAWHCSTCRSCILRRDHHCVFAMQCIGIKNQCNFMGFLLYTAAGTLYATVLSFLIAVYIQGVSCWVWLLRNVLIFYVILFDFSLNNLLASLNFIGCVFSVGVLVYYIRLSLAGQTSADHSRNVCRKVPGRSMFSLETMREFLGPSPFLRVAWPFHEVLPNGSYNSNDMKRFEKHQ